MQAVQYEELKDLHTVFESYAERVERINKRTLGEIVKLLLATRS